MWFPELLARVEDGGSPCANVSSPLHNQNCSPVNTAGGFKFGELTELDRNHNLGKSSVNKPN